MPLKLTEDTHLLKHSPPSITWSSSSNLSELCVHTSVEDGGLGAQSLVPPVSFLTSKIPPSPVGWLRNR